MFWFKNALIYQLTKSLDWSAEHLQKQLFANQYQPCQQSDMQKMGWTNPLKTSDLLHFTVGKQILLVAHKEDKILPAHVIKRELEQRIAQLEQKENRPLKKVEKQALKEDVIAILLPRAFSKHQHTAIWIDVEHQRIYVDTASTKRAEEVLALLRKSLGSLPVLPFAFAKEVGDEMSKWLGQNQSPAWLTILEEAELKGQQENSVIRCKKQNLYGEEVLTLLQSGKFVSQLALEWEHNLSFVLDESAVLKRLKFADEIREQNADILKEDVAQRFDADFVLMTSVLSQLMTNLLHEFGGEKALEHRNL